MAPAPEPKRDDQIERVSVRPQIKAVATPLESERREEPVLVLPNDPQPAELKDATPMPDENSKGWKKSQRKTG